VVEKGSPQTTDIVTTRRTRQAIRDDKPVV
jgi:hypothetical protein